MSDINCVTLTKGSEQYVWMYTYDTRERVLREVGKAASNPELSITWYDAAVVAMRIRDTIREIENEQRGNGTDHNRKHWTN